MPPTSRNPGTQFLMHARRKGTWPLYAIYVLTDLPWYSMNVEAASVARRYRTFSISLLDL